MYPNIFIKDEIQCNMQWTQIRSMQCVHYDIHHGKVYTVEDFHETKLCIYDGVVFFYIVNENWHS